MDSAYCTSHEERPDIPRIIRVDDHVIEPPDVFERWLPAKFHPRTPVVERHRLSRFRLRDGYYDIGIDDAGDGKVTDFWV
ncbi:MAG: hypothetical protein ACYDD6_00375 [Acidimicrobiales bacterium]